MTSREKADKYFQENYWDDKPENQQRAKEKIEGIIKELCELEKVIYPNLQEYSHTISDSRQELYVEFPPETYENIMERVDIIRADGWDFREIIKADGKEYGVFTRIKVG